MAPEDGEFEDYSIYFEDTDGAVVSITKNSYMDDSVPKLDILKGKNKLPLRYSDYDRDALIIENLPVKSVKLVSEKTGHGIRFGFEGFNVLGIWTPMHKRAPFICLEPWNGLPANVSETTDAKSKKYAITLAPGEEYAVGYNVEII
jgi:galactose mutarotase-like enzyme